MHHACHHHLSVVVGPVSLWLAPGAVTIFCPEVVASPTYVYRGGDAEDPRLLNVIPWSLRVVRDLGSEHGRGDPFSGPGRAMTPPPGSRGGFGLLFGPELVDVYC
jgi:hypothetical protein